ncbi:MAG TPA: CcmD family protein [Ginsengibacter sp.]
MIKLRFFRRLCLSVIFSFANFLLFAQSSADSSKTDMDSIMRSNDKIYVVMAVCITILVVLILYLIRIDIKISKKEKGF